MSDRSFVKLLALLSLVAGALLCYAPAPDTYNQVVRADFGASALVVAIITIASSLASWFRGRTNSSTAFAMEGMRSDITKSNGTLTKSILALAVEVAGAIGGVRRMIQKVFGPLYNMLKRLVEKIRAILQRILGPIIDFLNEVRKHIRDFYNKVVRPILDAIGIVRAFMRVLAAFNVDWAKKADQKLAELEGYINLPFDWLTKQLNRIENAIDRILTLDGLLQRFTLLNSVLRDLAYINNAALNGMLKYRGTGLIPRLPGEPAETNPETYINDLRVHFETGDGALSPRIRESIANVRILLERAAPSGF